MGGGGGMPGLDLTPHAPHVAVSHPLSIPLPLQKGLIGREIKRTCANRMCSVHRYHWWSHPTPQLCRHERRTTIITVLDGMSVARLDTAIAAPLNSHGTGAL